MSLYEDVIHEHQAWLWDELLTMCRALQVSNGLRYSLCQANSIIGLANKEERGEINFHFFEKRRLSLLHHQGLWKGLEDTFQI